MEKYIDDILDDFSSVPNSVQDLFLDFESSFDIDQY